MSGEPKVTIEGRVRVRDNKRWKPRYCIVTKASPVANSLQVHLHKEPKGGNGSAASAGANAGHDAGKRTLSKNGRTTVALDNFLGVQSGFQLDKESFTLAIFCQDSCVVLALENRENLALWEARLRLSMPEVCHFDAQLVKVPPCGKAQLGPCRLHIQDHQFSITTLTAQGPQVIHSWKLQDLRRFGKLEENLYGFEGGSRSGKGEGAHVLMLDDVSGLEGTLQVASHGLLNRQKKSVYNALMADLVGLRERMTSIHSLNSASSTTLAASVASSVYGGGSTLRRQIGPCHCHCGGNGVATAATGSPNTTSRPDQCGGPASTLTGANPQSAIASADYDASGALPVSGGTSAYTTSALASSATSTAATVGSPANGQPQHGRHSSTASQDMTDSVTQALESQSVTMKHCDRSSLCSESSGTGSCNGSVGVRSDESSDYDVPKNVAGGSASDTSKSILPCPVSCLAVSPSSCYDQPKNLASVTSGHVCSCQRFGTGGGACSGEHHPDTLLNYDVPAQLMGASNVTCSDYDTPKAVAEALWNQPSQGHSLLGGGLQGGAANGYPIGSIVDIDPSKVITGQGSLGPSASAGLHAHTGFGGHLQGQGVVGQGGLNVGTGYQQMRDRLLTNGLRSSNVGGATDAKTRLLFSQRPDQSSARSGLRVDQCQGQQPQTDINPGSISSTRMHSSDDGTLSSRYSLASASHMNSSNEHNLASLESMAPNQFCNQSVDAQHIGGIGIGQHISTTLSKVAADSIPSMSAAHTQQLLPNRRLLADSSPATNLTSKGLPSNSCAEHAIDFVNAQFMDLHLQYPLLEDRHLPNGASTQQGLTNGQAVPPAPSLV